MTDRVGPAFRREVLAQHTNRLQGSVNLATPIGWQLIASLIFTSVLAAIVYLATGSYARVAQADGVVVLDKGIAKIVASRAGVVKSISVAEGSQVNAGEALVQIQSEEGLIGGGAAPEQKRAAIAEQDERLEAQAEMTLRASNAEQARLREQIAGALKELTSIETQTAAQRRLIAAAESDYENAKKIAKRGFISQRDLDTREATVLARRQQLAQFQQLEAAKRAEVAETQRAMVEASATAQAQVASTQYSRAALAEQLAEASLAHGYAIRAPVAGTVTALTARVGQSVSNESPLLMIIPADSHPRAELYVPTASAGFLHKGQEVRIAVDAFPYQTYGTIVGEVRDISNAAVTRSGPDGPTPVYLVTADLPRPWIQAFGRREPLLPGMLLSARIVTKERSLFEWLFEPYFAVRRR